jgi:hypothetical protein
MQEVKTFSPGGRRCYLSLPSLVIICTHQTPSDRESCDNSRACEVFNDKNDFDKIPEDCQKDAWILTSAMVEVNFRAGFQASASESGGILEDTSPSNEWGGFGADSPSMSGGVLVNVHWKSKLPHSLRGSSHRD